MRARSTYYILLLALLAGLLAACGQPTAAVPTRTPPPSPTDTPQPVPGADLASIPQGRTTDGYQALGAAGAPVTLVMYSDFF